SPSYRAASCSWRPPTCSSTSSSTLPMPSPTRAFASADAAPGVARRFARQRGAMLGAGILAVLTILALGAPWWSPRDPIRTAARDALKAPGASPLFGTDQFGRDVASRVIYGARISLTVGLVAVSIAVFLGAPLGLVSGFYGGRLDAVVMRVVD